MSRSIRKALNDAFDAWECGNDGPIVDALNRGLNIVGDDPEPFSFERILDELAHNVEIARASYLASKDRLFVSIILEQSLPGFLKLAQDTLRRETGGVT